MKFSVQITETIVTHLEVEAEHSSDARWKVRSFGLAEAVNSFKIIDKKGRISLGYAVLLDANK